MRFLPELMDRAREDDIAPLGLMVVVKQLLWHGRTAEATELVDRLPPVTRDSSKYQRIATSCIATYYPSVIRPSALLAAGSSSPAQPPAAQMFGMLDWPVSGARTLIDVLTGSRRDNVVAEAEQLLETVHPQVRNRSRFGMALATLEALTYSNELSSATLWSRRLLAAVAESECVTLQALLQASAAALALRRGALPVAADLARQSFEGLSPAGWGALIGAPLSILVAVSTAIGDYAGAARYLAQPVPDAMFETRYGLHYFAARGAYLLAVDRTEGALADYLSCGELMTAWGVDVPGLEPWRLGAARAWLKKGNVGSARQLVAEQMSRLGNSDVRSRGATLRQLAAVSGPSQRRQVLHEAIELLQQCGDQLELAYALTDLSQLEAQCHDHRRSWVLNRKAAKVARGCGATRLYETLMSTSRSVVLRTTARSAVTALTTGERRVAALAVEGYTNPEIAHKLYITRSAVEQHLTRVYRKLGIHCRDELPTEI